MKDAGKEELHSRDDSVPWAAVAGLRNMLAHQYLGVDVKLVWGIVERDLPTLKAAVQTMLSDKAGANSH